MPRLRILVSLLVTLVSVSLARADEQDWKQELGAIPVQHNGRVMPLDTYARQLAIQLTGRSKWSADRGPEGYAGREPIELLCELWFRPQAFMGNAIIDIENRPFKKAVGLEEEPRFFTPMQIARAPGINDVLMGFSQRRQTDAKASPKGNEKIAMELSNALDRLSSFSAGQQLAIVPPKEGHEFLKVTWNAGDPGTEQVQQALADVRVAFMTGKPMEGPVKQLVDAVHGAGELSQHDLRSVHLEQFYNAHRPWRMTAYAYGLSIVVFGLSRLMLRKPLTFVAVLLGLWGVAEHALGISLRTMILQRAPVSNTYEALLWMGLVGIAVGLVAQLVNRKGWYLFAGVCAAFASVLFAGLVPLEQQTNALPAVLRSNYWLIVHVLTIVASYGVLAVASVLGHVYLFKYIILGKTADAGEGGPRASHPLIVQTYRTIQVGLFLLTAGTILGGVWAADSWGRFWGWDPKETWALISIVLYFAVLHARYIRWLRDFGLAAAAVLSFIAIVWTFYGVNYVMATGLHSYGFGSGGEVWVGLWAIIEIVFMVVARVRFVQLRAAGRIPDERPLKMKGSPTTA